MTDEKRTSITISALIWAGIVLMFLGVIILIFGLAKNSLFDFEFKDLKFSTSQTGLVITFLGAAISYFTTKNLRADISIHGDTPTFKEKLKRNIPLIAFIIGIIALVLLIILFIF